jgi:hypothetical protein
MKLKFFFSACLIFIVNLIYSQEVFIKIESGLGKYSMSGLRGINNYIIGQMPFDVGLESDFPPYFYYEPALLVKFGKVTTGLVYSFQSTGSRISSKDYSGEYRLDMKVRSSMTGLYGEYDIWAQKGYDFSCSGSFKGVFSRLLTEEMFTVLDETLLDDSQEYQSVSYLSELGLNFSKSFGFVKIGVSAGYAIDMGKKPFHIVDNEEITLKDPATNNEVKPSWGGWRTGISVSFRLFGKGTELKDISQ